jgi:SAM-dependent methyltransferase
MSIEQRHGDPSQPIKGNSLPLGEGWPSIDGVAREPILMLGSSIGRAVLGVSDPHDMPGSLLTAYETLTGEALSYRQFISEAGRLENLNLNENWATAAQNDRDRSNTVKTLRQTFEGGMQWYNNLRAWPLYQDMYEERTEAQQDIGSERTNSALLVGSLSSLSARAFKVLAHEVYGVNRACVIDVSAGSDKVRHATFVYGDAKKMPFGDNTMRIVQTNHIFDWLGDEAWKGDIASKEARAKTLLGEAARVLRPGGHLLLCEGAIGQEYTNGEANNSAHNRERLAVLETMLYTELPRLGFTDISVRPAYAIDDKSWVFDPTRDFTQYPTTNVTGAVGVYARRR